jgi:hypothetical protein
MEVGDADGVLELAAELGGRSEFRVEAPGDFHAVFVAVNHSIRTRFVSPDSAGQRDTHYHPMRPFCIFYWRFGLPGEPPATLTSENLTPEHPGRA